MARGLFPRRIETERHLFESISHDTIDLFEFYELTARGDWQGAATEHMPWFRFRHPDQIADFVDKAEQDAARYLLRSKEEDETMIGITGFSPEWEPRRAGSDIVLAKRYWGREYGLERASAFIELTFERYDLDAYYTTCAAHNEPSRRMIEKYGGKYGGQHEGLLRQHSPRPTGEVTDQHQFTILREEYEQRRWKH